MVPYFQPSWDITGIFDQNRERTLFIVYMHQGTICLLSVLSLLRRDFFCKYFLSCSVRVGFKDFKKPGQMWSNCRRLLLFQRCLTKLTEQVLWQDLLILRIQTRRQVKLLIKGRLSRLIYVKCELIVWCFGPTYFSVVALIEKVSLDC